MEGAPQFVSRAAYARHREVSKAAVTQWAAAGRIVTSEDGDVDLVASDKRLAESAGAARGGKRKRGTAGGVQDSSGVAQTGNGGTLYDARTAVANITAKSAEAEYLVRVGELVERARYAKALEDGLRPILGAMDSLSAVIGPALAAETDVRKVQNLLDDAMATIRKDASDTLLRMIAGPDTVRQ